MFWYFGIFVFLLVRNTGNVDNIYYNISLLNKYIFVPENGIKQIPFFSKNFNLRNLKTNQTKIKSEDFFSCFYYNNTSMCL